MKLSEFVHKKMQYTAHQSVGSPVYGNDINNVPDNVDVISWNTIVLPRPLLDFVRNTIAIPIAVLVKGIF
jgi:hypothetical protein